MNDSRLLIWSSIGKKLLTGFTGVALLAFIVLHLAGNLTLLAGSEAFNAYAHKLHSLGVLLYLAEIGLVALFALHAVSAIAVYLDKRRARTIENTMVESKGPPSRQTPASRTMIVTGGVLLVFTIFHLLHFRLGPGMDEGYITALGDERVRDLYRLVVERFQSLPFVLFYLIAMVLLGFHLRHGFWSAFQSIGALSPTLRPLAFSAGVVFAVAIAFGFFVLPIYLYVASPEIGGSGMLARGAQP